MSTSVGGLCRSVEFTLTRAADEPSDGLTLEGYAAVFDQRTAIDSWEGSFVETIRRGAFRKTIRERTPVMQFDHGRHPLVGSIPIGRIAQLREDEQGLYVSARLSDNWLVQPVREAIAEGAVDGMSFRFEVVRQEWRDANGKKLTDPDEISRLLWDAGDRGPLERTLIELRVQELGPVVFPAYEGTSVGVRAADVAGTILRDRDLQRDVRRALAADLPASLEADVPDDPELRNEIARAVLFNQTSSETADEAEPDEDVEERDDAPDTSTTSTTDAPPAPEAPVVTQDAPPAPSGSTGHPSLPDRDARLKYARLAYVTRNSVGKKYR